MARFCEKHMNRSVDTLKSLQFGTEYDLCEICRDEMAEILDGKQEEVKTEVNIGRKRTAGRPKAIKN